MKTRVDLLTKEYPPEIYGGAGVHVAELARSIRPLVDLRVHCLGGPRDEEGVTAYREPRLDDDASAALRCAPSERTWGWRRAAREPNSSTATPGTPTGPAISPAPCTAYRTSSPRTAWSPCVRGRPSNWAAATRSPRDVGREFNGRDEIRDWADDEVIGGRLTVLENTPKPGGTTLLVRFAPGGTGGFEANYEFDVRDGRIAELNPQYA